VSTPNMRTHNIAIPLLREDYKLQSWRNQTPHGTAFY
jgi:hypothetical protein